MKAPLYFFATNMGDATFAARYHDNLLVAMPNIRTKRHLADLSRWIANGKKIIIDSGVFELCSRHARANGISLTAALGLPPEQVDGFPALLDHYVQVAKQLPPVFALVEVDIGGKMHKRNTRRHLRDVHGLDVCPVVHPLIDGWDYLDEVAEEHDRIFIGNLVDASARFRLQAQVKLTDWKRSHPDKWLHLLGITPSASIISMPLDSCDSSNWLSSVRFPDTWKAAVLWVKCAGFDRSMVYRKRSSKAPDGFHSAKAIVAFDEHCQAISADHYYERLSAQ